MEPNSSHQEGVRVLSSCSFNHEDKPGYRFSLQYVLFLLCLFNSLIYPTGRKIFNISLIGHSLHLNSAYDQIIRNLTMKLVNQSSLVCDFDHAQPGWVIKLCVQNCTCSACRVLSWVWMNNIESCPFVRRSTWKSQLYFTLYKAHNHATSTHSMYNDSPLYILPSLLILILACTFAASPQPWTSGIPWVKQNLKAEKPLVIVIDRRSLGESFTYV